MFKKRKQRLAKERIRAQCEATLGRTPWAMEEKRRELEAQRNRQFWNSCRRRPTILEQIKRLLKIFK